MRRNIIQHIINTIGDSGLLISMALIISAFSGVAHTVPGTEWTTVYPPFKKLMWVALGFWVWFVISRFMEVNVGKTCKKYGIPVIK